MEYAAAISNGLRCVPAPRSNECSAEWEVTSTLQGHLYSMSPLGKPKDVSLSRHVLRRSGFASRETLESIEKSGGC